MNIGRDRRDGVMSLGMSLWCMAANVPDQATRPVWRSARRNFNRTILWKKSLPRPFPSPSTSYASLSLIHFPSTFIHTTMAFTTWLALLLTHPTEFRTLLQFRLYHEQKRDITHVKEHATSGWDRENMRKCWQFLDQTSRSFSAVIKELDGDLARTVSILSFRLYCPFY